MFDLETAIAFWRSSLQHNRSIRANDLDELERHIRDQVAALVEAGLTDEEAFKRSMREMGGFNVIDTEYRRVYWGKLRRQHRLRREFARMLYMFQNYIRLAWRNIRRHPGYALVNTMGLATGIACCLVILLFIRDELSYDRFHEATERMYRIYSEFEGGQSSAVTSAPLAEAVAREFPEIERVTHLFRHWNTPLVSHRKNAFMEDRFLFADSAFFEVFSFELLRGDPSVVLDEPLAVVLSESMARKYFGDEDPVGQRLSFNAEHDFTVTGVMKDAPSNTHVHADFVASLSSLPRILWPSILNMWTFNTFHTYAVLRDGASPDALESKLSGLPGRYLEGSNTRLHLQPLTDIHIDSSIANEIEAGSDIRYIVVLGALGLLILFIACINHTNLAMARSVNRAREVGLRKVVGAHRTQLIQQFYGESFVQTMLALAIGIGLAWLSLPLVNDLTGKRLSLALLDGWIAGGLLGILLIAALATGSYPALILSRLWPADVLRGHGIARGRRSLSRKCLVGFQFAATSVFLIAVLIIAGQLEFLQSTRIGFNKSQVVVLPVQDPGIRKNSEVLLQTLSQQAGVVAVGSGNARPGSNMPSGSLAVEGMNEDESVVAFGTWIDDGYLGTLEIELVAGRGFSRAQDSGQNVALVNRSAVAAMGWSTPDEALGATITTSLDSRSGFRIVGVVDDYHFESLHHSIQPLVLFGQFGGTSTVLVRIRPDDIPATLATVSDIWDRFAVEQPFVYSFLDADFDRSYRSEQRWVKVMSLATILAILMSCLGLFSLAAFVTEQRKREIGIRKVLGASIGSVVYHINKDFLTPVSLGFLLAVPFAFFIMSRWLQNFAYRVDMRPGVFLIAAIVIFSGAALAVSFQSIRAAAADPVRSIVRE